MSAEISTKLNQRPLGAEDLGKLSVPSRPESVPKMPSHSLHHGERSSQEINRGIRAGRQLVEGLSRLVQSNQDLSRLPYDFQKGYQALAATLRVDATLLSRAAASDPGRADEYRPAAAERTMQAHAIQSLAANFREPKEQLAPNEADARKRTS